MHRLPSERVLPLLSSLIALLPRLALGAGLTLSTAPAMASGSAPVETVTMQGSTTFTSRLIEPYRADIEARAGRRLDVIANKSIHGLLALIEGRTMLAMISSSLDGERELIRAKYPKLPVDELRTFEVARTRIAFAVHPTNAVRRATLADVGRILLGDIRNWREMGGPDLAVTVVTTQPGGGVPTTVRGQLLDGRSFAAPRLVEVEAASHVVKITAQIEGALGVVQLGLLRAAKVAELETDGRIEQQLNLVTLGEPGPAALAVIEAARHVAAVNHF